MATHPASDPTKANNPRSARAPAPERAGLMPSLFLTALETRTARTSIASRTAVSMAPAESAEPGRKHQEPRGSASAHGVTGTPLVDPVRSHQDPDRHIESRPDAQQDSEAPPGSPPCQPRRDHVVRPAVLDMPPPPGSPQPYRCPPLHAPRLAAQTPNRRGAIDRAGNRRIKSSSW